MIPPFGARELLHRCLPAVEQELARAGLNGTSEIIVADDATPDGLGAELPGFFDGCLAAFEDRSLFAVTGQILEPSGTQTRAANAWRWKAPAS